MTVNNFKYLTPTSKELEWGIYCTTVGFQNIDSLSPYPATKHPDSYNFTHQRRILEEYQLVYIYEGEGIFSSTHCPQKKVTAGTMIVLFPGEAHTYRPLKDTGWKEHWVGFKGVYADRIMSRFFSVEKPLLNVGIRQSIFDIYEKILQYASGQAAGFQQIVGGYICSLIGVTYFENINISSSGAAHDIVNKVQALVQENIKSSVSPAYYAKQLGISYSLLRSVFKSYTGMSVSAYKQQCRLAMAKDLLVNSTYNISEIAYSVGFDSITRFSAFFKEGTGVSPSDYRKQKKV